MNSVMKDTAEKEITDILEQQRAYFNRQQTKSLKFRVEQLKKFKAAVKKYEQEITDALFKDLHKSSEEAFLTEISIVLQEVDYHLAHLHQWTKPERVSTPAYMFPSSGKVVQEPLGIALIMAPWNYPFQLLMNPLIGAISSGCCALVKPSPSVPTVSSVIDKLIRETFDPEYIAIVHGGKEVNELLFKQRFDLVFFTGSPAVGKIVMRAAAENLTPSVLELGGKSPCIVDADANISVAAKRIAWGKTINAGQTCIAPDYLFVHHSVKEELLKKIQRHIEKMYGPDIRKSDYFGRIVDETAFERVSGLLKEGTIVYGGETVAEEKYIAPTIIDNVEPGFAIMQQEIFGPVLPVMTFENLDEPVAYINSHEKPLALYYFGKSKSAEKVLSATSSGGVCINDTLMHVANHDLPFGGVGNSGTGSYHGHKSFLAFSHAKSVVTTPTWIDIPMKYAPFRHFGWIKKLL